MPIATVLVATHDHGPMLLRSVGTALNQSVRDVEVFIVGDGATAATRAAAERLSGDSRVRFFDFPKGPHHGGEHRHRALAHAEGEIVCYLDDDDLWHRDHVATLHELLTAADFAHTLPLVVTAEGRLQSWGVDLSRAADREELMAGRLGLAKSVAGHTRRIYGELPHGWRNVEGAETVRDVWRQIAGRPGCRIAASTRPTALQLPAAWREGWPRDRRLAELDDWNERLASPSWPLLVLDYFVRETADLQRHLAEVRGWLREGERAAVSWRDAWESAQQSLAEARAYAESLEAERNARR
jgi:hypothetical protein